MIAIMITITIPVASHGDSIAVNRTCVALGSVAGEAIAHRDYGVAIGAVAHRLAITLANEPDRLAIGGCLLAMGFAILSVTRRLRRNGCRISGAGIPRHR